MNARVLTLPSFVLACFVALTSYSAASQLPSLRISSNHMFDGVIANHQPVVMRFSNGLDMPIRSEGLKAEALFDRFTIGYSEGPIIGRITSGSAVQLLDTREVSTVLGRQTWLKVGTSDHLTGWIPADSVVVTKDASSPGTTMEIKVLPWWKTNSYSIACLTFGLSFGAFFFGIYVRHAVFKEADARPLRHQFLLAVPVSLFVVPSELMAYTKALPAGGPFLMVSTFLCALGLVMIQGVLIRELTRRLIEKRMRKSAEHEDAGATQVAPANLFDRYSPVASSVES